MIDNYVSLHVHSDYSRLDAISKISDLAEKAKKLGMKSLALTDHGTISGWIKFYQECIARDIKPIFGIEAYICDDHNLIARTDKEIVEQEDKKKNSMGPLFEMIGGELGEDHDATIDDLKKKKTGARKSNHVIILAKNKTGYNNIMKLSSIAYVDGYYYKPRIDLKLLEKYKEGLIVNSACLGGQISSQILKGNMEKAEWYLKEYVRIFGEDFHLELQLHPVDEQVTVNKALLELSKKFNVKTIISQDHHYTEKEDVFLHEVVIKLKNGQKDSKVKKNGDLPSEAQLAKELKRMGGRQAFMVKDVMEDKIKKDQQASDSDGYFYNAREYYFKSFEELKVSWKESHSYMTEEEFYGSLENTLKIADKVDNISAYSTDVFLPKFDSGDKTAREFLRDLIREGAIKKLKPKVKGNPELKKKYDARLKEELDIICDLKFEEYFLIVWDLINWCRENDIIVGPGRGCLTPESMIKTDSGIKPIKDVVIGDKVVSDDGKYNKIVNTFSYDINEDVIEINHKYRNFFDKPAYTSDHKILVVKNKKTNYKSESLRKFCIPQISSNVKLPESINISRNNKLDEIKPSYVESKNVEKGDFLCLPITKHEGKDIKSFDLFKHVDKRTTTNTNYIFEQVSNNQYNMGSQRKHKRIIKCDTQFLEVLGLYISDGWSRKSHGNIAFGFHSTKNNSQIKLVEDFCERYGFYHKNIKHKQKKLIQIQIYSRSLRSLFDSLVDKYAENKNINKDIFNLPNRKIVSLIKGLMGGDGHVKSSCNDKNCYDSINLDLILDIKEIFIRLGIPSSVYIRKADGKSIVHDCYKLMIATNDLFGKTKKYNYYRDDNYIYLPVTGVSTKKHKGKVYDLKVNKNHSFRTSNYVVHNSVGGSLVAYCTSITNVDPIEHGLLFTRFINKTRSNAKYKLEYDGFELAKK